jgi:hypothetical protein
MSSSFLSLVHESKSAIVDHGIDENYTLDIFEMIASISEPT